MISSVVARYSFDCEECGEHHKASDKLYFQTETVSEHGKLTQRTKRLCEDCGALLEE